MNLRVLAVLIPVAILGAACSSPAASPTGTFAPSAVVADPSPPIAPTTAPSVAPSATPSAVALDREVPVTMTDTMRFAPDSITVKAGVPITFVVENAGVIVHEFFVGTEAEQAEHAAEMAMGEMAHGHDNAVSVEPGKTSSLTMTFAEAGSILVGCHEPGHYDAGMKATLTVVD